VHEPDVTGIRARGHRDSDQSQPTTASPRRPISRSSAGDDDLPLALAASSFADGTRVAGTRPELVLAMCEGNRDALLAAVDDALGRLGAMRGALASTGGLAATVRAGHAGRMRWAAARDPQPVRVHRGRTPPAELREIGRRGDAVVGWA
jgi:prephenate dehydrogenase